MSASRAWLRPWAVAMFGAIGVLVVWRLYATPAKPADTTSTAAPTATMIESAIATAVATTTLATATTAALPPAPPPTVTTTPAEPTSTGTAAPTVSASATAATSASAEPPAQASAEPTLDPASLRARQAQTIALLEKRITALEEAARAAQIKGDPAEVQRLQDQTAQAKKRLALMRLGTE